MAFEPVVAVDSIDEISVAEAAPIPPGLRGGGVAVADDAIEADASGMLWLAADEAIEGDTSGVL